MRHPRKLVDDRDFVVLERGAHLWTPSGYRYSRKVHKVWLMETEAEAFICANCYKFTAEKARGVIGHMAVHSGANAHNGDTRREAAAFRLLPKKVQRAYLAKLAEQEVGADGTGDDGEV